MAIEEFTSVASRDFRQRYQNTYGYFTTDAGKRLLVYLSTVKDHESEFCDADGITYRALADKGVFFEFIPLERRLFVHKDTLKLACRRPARQWSRGICSANSTITGVAYGSQHEVDFDVVTAYDSNKHGWKDAKAFTLNNMIGVDNNTIFLYNTAIGTLQDEVARLTTSMFVQEAIDTFKASGRDIRVEVE